MLLEDRSQKTEARSKKSSNKDHEPRTRTFSLKDHCPHMHLLKSLEFFFQKETLVNVAFKFEYN